MKRRIMVLASFLLFTGFMFLPLAGYAKDDLVIEMPATKQQVDGKTWRIGNILVTERYDEDGNLIFEARGAGSAGGSAESRVNNNNAEEVYGYQQEEELEEDNQRQESRRKLPEDDPLVLAYREAEQRKDYDSIKAAFEEAEQRWGEFYSDIWSLGEKYGAYLCEDMSDVPGTFDLFTAWFDFAVDQENLFRISSEIISFFSYIENQDPGRRQEAIEYLEGLLQREWASEKAKERTVETTGSALSRFSS